MARVGFIGTGEIASAMVRGLCDQGHDILISDRNAAISAKLSADITGVRIGTNAEVVAGSDIVFLCLLARVANEVLPGLPFREDQSVISVMVDMPLAQLHALCAPAADIAITIPLPPIVNGGCPLPVFPASKALELLFGDRNPVFTLKNETAINAHLGVSALCSPILDQMLTAADWLAGFTGDTTQAEAYVNAMIRIYLLERPNEGHLRDSLQKLSTEGGLNATLRKAMSPAKSELLLGLDGFRTRLGLGSIGGQNA